LTIMERTNFTPFLTKLKRKTGLIALIGLFFFAFFGETQASHFIGAEITYECIATNQYRVTLNYFRDCDGINFGSNQNLVIQGCSGAPTTMLVTRISITDVTSLCPSQTSSCQGGSVPGVEKHVYQGTLTLPASCPGVTLSASSCCRNTPITSIVNPSNTGWYVETFLSNNNAVCNSSPVFQNPGFGSGCVGQQVNYNHGVIDPDGDDLVFSLGDCYGSANTPVNYVAGLSGTSPLFTSGGVSINSLTGAISFTPDFVQIGVICVLVEEYRNGVKIGELTRDIQFDITNCGSNTAPTASGPYLYNTAPNQQICFNITGSDPNPGDLIKMSTNNGIPGGTFTPSLPTGFLASPSTQFCWTPTLADQNQTHFFTITVQDDACPNAGINTFTYEVVVGSGCDDPVANCKNISVNLNANGVASISPGDIDNNSTFDCGFQSWNVSKSSFDCGDRGANNVTLTIYDDEGNSDNCTSTVTVVDNSKPVPNMANLPTITGQCKATVNSAPTATDNCAGQVTATTTDPTSFNAQGTYIITWIYNDGNGNIETQIQIVIVDDIVKPVPDVASLPTIMGQCDASVDPPTATDNCAGEITGTTTDQTSFTAQGTYYITWTYDDGNGNTKMQTQTVVVEDTEAPDISCPADITQPNDQGVCGGNVYFNVSASDNCGETTIVCTIGGNDDGGSEPSGDCATNNVDLSITFDNYPEETSWIILDKNTEIVVESGGPYGNEPDASTLDLSFDLPDGEYVFMIRDVIGDGICCSYGLGSYTLSSEGDVIGTGGDFDYNEKIPFCVEAPASGGGTPLTVVQSGDFFPVGTHTVTCTATDGNGLTDVCTFDITVNDTEAPMLVDDCPDNITLCGAQTVDWDEPSASDNCGVINVDNNYNPGDFFDVGTYTVTYTFSDEAGLSVSCSFLITINPVPEVEITQDDLPTWCQGIQVLTANVLNPNELTFPLTFAWSDGLGNNPAVVAPANGPYTVTITDALGCSTVETTIVDEDISELLSAYTIISGEEFEMYESEVLGGGVGIEDADEAEIAQFSSIFTFLKANTEDVQIDGTSFVNNLIDDDFDVPLPPFMSNPFNSFNNVSVPANSTVTLSGNNYGYVFVGNGATLIIDVPQVYMRNLQTGAGATIIFNQPTEIMIRRKMNIGQSNVINPDGYTSVIYVSDNAEVGQGSQVTCSIYAPEGLDVSDSGATMTTFMTGTFISDDRIFSDHLVVWDWNLNCSFISSSDPIVPNFNEFIDPSVPESSITGKQGLTIYPNPSSGIFQVDVSNYEGKAIDMAIYDQLGREVWNYSTPEIQEAVIQVDMSSGVFVNSVYTLQLRSEGQSEIDMFVLDRK
jgi:hypothetical protein